MNINKHFFWAIAILLSLYACVNEVELTCPEEKMVAVLKDIQLAEASVQGVIKVQKDSILKRCYQQIFELHDISADLVEENMLIIEKNASISERIYEKVLEELTKIKVEEEKAINKPLNPSKDSLKASSNEKKLRKK